EAGGLTFVQDEQTASHAEMPRAAIASGAADFVLSPEEIALELQRAAKLPYVRRERPPAPEVPGFDTNDYGRLLAIVRTVTGVDFSGYRQTTIRRRVERRMALSRLEEV